MRLDFEEANTAFGDSFTTLQLRRCRPAVTHVAVSVVPSTPWQGFLTSDRNVREESIFLLITRTSSSFANATV